jgi:hypothetical protein
LQQGCCSDSSDPSEFDYESEEEEVLINQNCACENPNFCSCEDTTESEPNLQFERKLKVCMFSNTGDQDSQMLAQIKALPEGDMKNSLLETFLNTMKEGQRLKNHESLNKGSQPLFLEASFERNTKSFIKYNKEANMQHTSIIDLAKDLVLLKKEVVDLKNKLKHFEEESENCYKIDSWARQEIQTMREQLDSRPPPLEDVPMKTMPLNAAQLQGLNAMKILPVRFQKYHIQIKIEINYEVFCLKALLDTGSDMNLLDKDLIPHKYWFPSRFSAIGIGNISTNMDFEIPKGNILIDDYALGMKFLLSDLPVDCILGTPFLSTVEPHGSAKTTEGNPGYFITMPTQKKNLGFYL